jgi:hypothetical protein
MVREKPAADLISRYTLMLVRFRQNAGNEARNADGAVDSLGTIRTSVFLVVTRAS